MLWKSFTEVYQIETRTELEDTLVHSEKTEVIDIIGDDKKKG